jgi:RNA polymerase sigma factor (sigma-70 family)
MLIAQIAQGNAHALRQIYAIYRPRLWRDLWRDLWRQLDGDQSGVEDALQEVFLGVWRAAAFRGESAVNTWVFRIAHHHIRNHQRASAVQSTTGNQVMLHEIGDVWSVYGG